jgi:hypothetical protein
MGILNRGGFTVDYTYLKKKGLLKVDEPAKSIGKVDKQGFVELANSDKLISEVNQTIASSPVSFAGFQSTTAPTTPISQPTVQDASPFDMLNSFSTIGQANDLSQSSFSPTASPSSGFSNPIPSLTLTNPDRGNEFAHLRVKLEDLEYKMDRFLERFDKMENKLLEFESRIGRPF